MDVVHIQHKAKIEMGDELCALDTVVLCEAGLLVV